MPIIDMLFIFHKVSVYTNSPLKDMEYVAKSFVTLSTTKALWTQGDGPRDNQNISQQEETIAEGKRKISANATSSWSMIS